MTACGTDAAAARSAMNTGSESGGTAGAPASPMRKRVRSISAGGAGGTAAGAAPPALAWPHPCSPIHRDVHAASRHAEDLIRPLAFLQAAERTILGGVDGGAAAPLEGVEEGRGQELVPESQQVLEGGQSLLGRHDFGQPPAPGLDFQELFDDPLSGFRLCRVHEQHAVEPVLFLVARAGHHVGLQSGGAVRHLLELVGRERREQVRIPDRQHSGGPPAWAEERFGGGERRGAAPLVRVDRKSTRLNSSHRCISYAVFCLKKKKK